MDNGNSFLKTCRTLGTESISDNGYLQMYIWFFITRACLQVIYFFLSFSYNKKHIRRELKTSYYRKRLTKGNISYTKILKNKLSNFLDETK